MERWLTIIPLTIATSEHLSCARHCAKNFICIILFNPGTFFRQGIVAIPFYKLILKTLKLKEVNGSQSQVRKGTKFQT